MVKTDFIYSRLLQCDIIIFLGQLKAITVLLSYKNDINIDVLKSIVHLCMDIIQYTLNAIGSHTKGNVLNNHI